MHLRDLNSSMQAEAGQRIPRGETAGKCGKHIRSHPFCHFSEEIPSFVWKVPRSHPSPACARRRPRGSEGHRSGPAGLIYTRPGHLQVQLRPNPTLCQGWISVEENWHPTIKGLLSSSALFFGRHLPIPETSMSLQPVLIEASLNRIMLITHWLCQP